MKQKFTLAFLLLIVFTAYTTLAQPVLVGSSPRIGFKTTAYTGAPLNVGASGDNVTWNFSTAGLNPEGDVEVYLPTATTYYANYSASNFSLRITQGGFNFFNYYHYDATKLEIMGTGIGSGVVDMDCRQDYRLWLKFPFHYLDTAKDIWRDNGAKYQDSILYDAYGTLITQFDTFTNVARTKTITRDSAGTVVDITYTWFSSDSLFELLAIDSSQTLMFKSKPGPLSIINASASNSGRTLKVYPNPATNFVIIDNGSLKGDFILYDLSGRLVKQQALDEEEQKISLYGINAGLYYYSVMRSETGQKLTGKLLISQ